MIYLLPRPYRDFLLPPLEISSIRCYRAARRLSLVTLTLLTIYTANIDLTRQPLPLIFCTFSSIPATVIVGGSLVFTTALKVGLIQGIAIRSLQQTLMGLSGMVLSWYSLEYHDVDFFHRGMLERHSDI